MIEEDDGTLAEYFVNDPAAFLAEIDNVAWWGAEAQGILEMLIYSDEEYVIETEDDIYKLIFEKADEYSLHAYQQYSAEAVYIEDKCAMILYMADVDRMLISTYIIITYDEENGFSYFLTERSFEDLYMLCEIRDNAHLNYGTVKNDRTSVIMAVKKLISE